MVEHLIHNLKSKGSDPTAGSVKEKNSDFF